jgi:hypothetical protein
MHGQIRPPNVYFGSNVWAAKVAHSVCIIRATFVVRSDRECVPIFAHVHTDRPRKVLDFNSAAWAYDPPMGFVIWVHGGKILVLHAHALHKRRLHADMHGQNIPPYAYSYSNVWAAEVARSMCCIRAMFAIRFNLKCFLCLAFPEGTGVTCDGLFGVLVILVITPALFHLYTHRPRRALDSNSAAWAYNPSMSSVTQGHVGKITVLRVHAFPN